MRLITLTVNKMDSRKTVVCVWIFVFSFFFVESSFSQIAENDNRTKRRAAWADFVTENTVTTSRWNYESDRLETLFDKIKQDHTGTPTELVESFIASNRELLGLEKGHELVLENTTRSSAGGIRYWYQQYYQGLKVLSGGYLFAVNRLLSGTPVFENPEGLSPSPGQKMFTSEDYQNYSESRNDWYIYFIKGAFAPDIHIEIDPEISEASARSSALSTLNQITRGPLTTRLAIKIDKLDPHQQELVFQVIGKTIEGKKFESIIDAFTGRVLDSVTSRRAGINSEVGQRRRNYRKSFQSPLLTISPCYPMTDLARAYPSHPDDSSLQNFTIYPCSASPQILNGWFANVVPETGSRVSGDVTGIDPGDPGWEEVSAYFHVTSASEYFYGHGFLDDVWDDDDVIQIQVTITEEDSPGYVEFEDEMYLSKEPADPNISVAYEASVMAHETAHILIEQFTQLLETCDQAQERCGFHEGIADYMGIIYKNFRNGTISVPWTDPVIGEYFLPPDSTDQDVPRDLSNPDPHLDDLADPSIYDWTGEDKLVQNKYDSGMILSTALMDFDQAHGNFSFSYIPEMLKNLPSYPDFNDARDALDAAMTQTVVSYNPVFYSGSTYYVLCTLSIEECQSPSAWAMYNRGIGTEPTGGAKRGRENKSADPIILPISTKLLPAYPNPFNPVATVRFDVSESTKVTIKIIDVLGRHVETLVSSQFAPGEHTVTWNAESHQSGTYFVELITDKYRSTQKIVLLK